MTNEADFDALTRKTIESNGAMKDLNNLYGNALALAQWHFIARGVFPNVSPYIASNAQYADGQQMVRAFTDTVRLQRFAKENNLTEADGGALILSLPTENIIDYLEQFIAAGVHGIWFNSDSDSDGFFIPLKQLRPIKEHLKKTNWQKSESPVIDEKKPTVETLIIIVKDGLMFPSGFVSAATYTCNLFCRVPSEWIEGEHLKENYLERIYQKVYGASWRSGNNDGSRYVVQDSYSKVFTPEVAKNTKWSGTVNDDANHFWFYIASENGEIKNVTSEEFQADINNYFNPPPKNGSIISSFQQGSVKSDTSLNPFFRAVAPLLENYAGAGEFTELFSPGNGENDMSDLFEDVTRNAHGAYLEYKSYVFRRHGIEPPVEIQTIGSNRLKHVQTNEKLIVNFTLSKDASATKLIVRFLGIESEVENLLNAVKPALENCEFKELLQMKGEPPAESLKLLEDDV